LSERRDLEEQLRRIDALIEEAEKRLGAHSVKPALMQELLELEEKREALLKKLSPP
jgi:hypothetical protein